MPVPNQCEYKPNICIGQLKEKRPGRNVLNTYMYMVCISNSARMHIVITTSDRMVSSIFSTILEFLE